MRVIIKTAPNRCGDFIFLQMCGNGKMLPAIREMIVAKRLLEERSVIVSGMAPSLGAARGPKGKGMVRSGRSVTVNAAESPLGWLRSRGHVSARQYDAGE